MRSFLLCSITALLALAVMGADSFGQATYQRWSDLLGPTATPEERAKFDIRAPWVIEQMLRDQRQMLLSAKAALDTWDAGTRISFEKAYGATDERTRQIVAQRIENALDLNSKYTVANFKPRESDGNNEEG